MKESLLLLAALTLSLFLHSHYRLSIVLGQSMAPTLKTGEILLVDKWAYDGSEPARGDLIVARYDADWVVKRVVGLPGEEVEVRNGRLYIDLHPLQENHPVTPGSLDVEKGNLLEGDYATLGDNRSIPRSLAIHPIVTQADILGKVILVIGVKS